MTSGHGISRLPGGSDTLRCDAQLCISPPPSFHTGQKVTPGQRGRQLQPGLGPSKQTICPVNWALFEFTETSKAWRHSPITNLNGVDIWISGRRLDTVTTGYCQQCWRLDE